MAKREPKAGRIRQKPQAIDWQALNKRARRVRKGLSTKEKAVVLELVAAGLTWAEIVTEAGSEEILDKVAGSVGHDQAFHAAMLEALSKAREARKIRLESRIYGVEQVDDSASLVQRHKLLVKLEEESAMQHNPKSKAQAIGQGIGQGIAAALIAARQQSTQQPTLTDSATPTGKGADSDVIDVPLV